MDVSGCSVRNWQACCFRPNFRRRCLDWHLEKGVPGLGHSCDNGSKCVSPTVQKWHVVVQDELFQRWIQIIMSMMREDIDVLYGEVFAVSCNKCNACSSCSCMEFFYNKRSVFPRKKWPIPSWLSKKCYFNQLPSKTQWEIMWWNLHQMFTKCICTVCVIICSGNILRTRGLEIFRYWISLSYPGTEVAALSRPSLRPGEILFCICYC